MNHDCDGDGRANGRAQAAGRVADTLHEPTFVPREPHLHRPRSSWECPRLTHAEREANAPERTEAQSSGCEYSDHRPVGHDGRQNSPGTKSVAQPSTGHLKKRIGPNEGPENNA